MRGEAKRVAGGPQGPRAATYSDLLVKVKRGNRESLAETELVGLLTYGRSRRRSSLGPSRSPSARRTHLYAASRAAGACGASVAVGRRTRPTARSTSA